MKLNSLIDTNNSFQNNYYDETFVLLKKGKSLSPLDLPFEEIKKLMLR